jgi:hypothetical protein
MEKEFQNLSFHGNYLWVLSFGSLQALPAWLNFTISHDEHEKHADDANVFPIPISYIP